VDGGLPIDLHIEVATESLQDTLLERFLGTTNYYTWVGAEITFFNDPGIRASS
jgi:hypothetical protein